MNISLFLIISSVLTIFYFFVGLYASKNIKSTSDYFLAGRNLGLGSIAFTLIATQLGGGMLLGTAQEAYQSGIYGILYTLGMVIGFFILAAGVAAKMQTLGVSTTAELFETKYKSASLKRFASLLSVITMSGILLAQVVGSKALIIGLGVQNEPLFIGLWIFIIAYTMIGGLYAVVLTDIFQVLIILAVFLAIFGYSIWLEPSSFFTWNGLTAMQSQFAQTKMGLSEFVATLSMPILFSLIEQDLAQRFFAARTKTIAGLSALIAGICLILFSLVPIYLGAKAKLLGLPLIPGASPLMPVLELLTNELVLVLAVCAIIAAITSTADSLLCAISSNIALDFDLSWTGVKDPVKRSQVITLFIGTAALLGSYFVPQQIIPIMIESYAISVSCLLVPLLFAYFKKEVKKSAAIGAVAAGLVTFVAIQFWNTELPKSLLPVALSLVAYLICDRNSGN
jgi:SSS family solute:Na+ symporter